MELVRCMPWCPSITGAKQRLDGPEEAKVEQSVFTSAHPRGTLLSKSLLFTSCETLGKLFIFLGQLFYL